MIGKMARMVSETSLTESSIPPICAKMEFEMSNKSAAKETGFFILNWFKFLFIFVV
jgi:hypothetical protein